MLRRPIVGPAYNVRKFNINNMIRLPFVMVSCRSFWTSLRASDNIPKAYQNEGMPMPGTQFIHRPISHWHVALSQSSQERQAQSPSLSSAGSYDPRPHVPFASFVHFATKGMRKL